MPHRYLVTADASYTRSNSTPGAMDLNVTFNGNTQWVYP
jgi:hypothetical protein